MSDQLGIFSSTLVLTGPVVGKVTSTSAVVLLEVDVDSTITIVLTPSSSSNNDNDAKEVRQSRTFPSGRARAFYLQGLKPDTLYTYSFEGLASSQKAALDALAKTTSCTIKTFPEKIDKIRIIALSCDRPRRIQEGDENPWDRILQQECTSRQQGHNNYCDVMLHLGDQVYTCMDGFLERAEMKMAMFDHPSATLIEQRKMVHAAGNELRAAYRYTWNLPSVKATLAQGSHLMIWSDNDVANDFTEKKKENGNDDEQYYSPQFVAGAMRVYTEYQRQLWDPSCEGILPHEKDPSKVDSLMEEWYFEQIGEKLGIFMVDMRGNRVTSCGRVQFGRTILSDQQVQALEAAFATPGLSCMLICSEIPFVTSNPKRVQKNAKTFEFLTGHWCWEEERTGALFDLCFDWKAQKEGRQVLLMGGDVHVGFTTDLYCNKTNSTIQCVTASPITNHVCNFYEEMEGDFNERYHFKHTVFPAMRNYSVVEATFDDEGGCQLDVKMELIPATPDDD